MHCLMKDVIYVDMVAAYLGHPMQITYKENTALRPTRYMSAGVLAFWLTAKPRVVVMLSATR